MRIIRVSSARRPSRGKGGALPLRAAAALLALLVGGCGGVYSRSPASDEQTSRLDDRLLGFWRAEDGAGKEGDTGGKRSEILLAVGRKSGTEKTLEVATIEIRADKTLDTTREEFLVTTLVTPVGAREYASVRLVGSPPKPEEPPSWIVLRYEMPDADTLRVVGMDEAPVAADVRAGAIPGTVAESRSGEKAPPQLTVTLEATTPALRAWLEKRGDGVFRTSQPLVLRRLAPR